MIGILPSTVQEFSKSNQKQKSFAFWFVLFSVFEESVHEYEDCRGQYQQPVGIASGLISDAAITSSSFLKRREPWTGRLYDVAGECWYT